MKKSNVSIIIYGTNTQPVKIELFNALNSFTYQTTDFFNVPNWNNFPLSSFTSHGAAIGGKVGFNDAGGLLLYNNAGTEYITVSMREGSYKALLTALQSRTAKVSHTHISFSNPAQIDENWIITESGVLGNTGEETLNLRGFFTPESIQPNILEINEQIIISPETGIKFNLLPAGSITTITMAIEII